MALKHVWMRLRDRLRFAWAKSKYDFVPQGRIDTFSFDSCYHIVVLKLDGKLGDTQVMSHFYAALRAHNPLIQLSVVCSPNLAEIYRDILHFDNVLTASRKPRFKEIQKLCQELKNKSPVSAVGKIGSERIDLVITTEPNFRPRDFIFNYLLQPRFIAGCETRVDSVNILLYNPSIRTKRVADCFIDFMDLGHLAYGPLQYTRFVTPESLKRMRKWLYLSEPNTQTESESETNKPNLGEFAPTPRDRRFLLAINPLASSTSRSFREDFVLALIQELHTKLGSSANKEDPHADKILLSEHSGEAVETGAETSSNPAGASGSISGDNSHAQTQVDTAQTMLAHEPSEPSKPMAGTPSSSSNLPFAPSQAQVEATRLEVEKIKDDNQNSVKSEKFYEMEDQPTFKVLATLNEYGIEIERDLEFVFLLPPSANELKNKIKSAAENCGASVFFLPDNSTALDLASAIDLCDALITVDTAAVHMACASNKPQLCVYTGTDLNESMRWAPIGNKAQVVRYENRTVQELTTSSLLQHAHKFVKNQMH